VNVRSIFQNKVTGEFLCADDSTTKELGLAGIFTTVAAIKNPEEWNIFEVVNIDGLDYICTSSNGRRNMRFER